jgi:hypothetical protein
MIHQLFKQLVLAILRRENLPQQADALVSISRARRTRRPKSSVSDIDL